MCNCNCGKGSITIPKGPKGDPGPAGTVTIGTVTTLDPGEDATVSNSGTSTAAVLNFGIPEGEPGAAGAIGSSLTIEDFDDVATSAGGDHLLFCNLDALTQDGDGFELLSMATASTNDSLVITGAGSAFSGIPSGTLLVPFANAFVTFKLTCLKVGSAFKGFYECIVTDSDSPASVVVMYANTTGITPASFTGNYALKVSSQGGPGMVIKFSVLKRLLKTV
jgi:hypothetical protein